MFNIGILSNSLLTASIPNFLEYLPSWNDPIFLGIAGALVFTELMLLGAHIFSRGKPKSSSAFENAKVISLGDGGVIVRTSSGDRLIQIVPKKKRKLNRTIEMQVGNHLVRGREVPTLKGDITVHEKCPQCSYKNDDNQTSCPSCQFPLIFLKDGSYALIKQIGSGGQADIYLAYDATLSRRGKLVVKILRDGNYQKFGLKELATQRFVNEIKALGELSDVSDHFVKVLDFGNHPDVGRFYVMEYLEGMTLEEKRESCVSARGENAIMPFNHVLSVFTQICDAVQIAHNHRILHRDLKPGNIFLVPTEFGFFVKIFDFGLVRFMESMGSVQMAGTPEYMSPEQWYQDKPTVSMDIYSLGIMLNELLIGATPFKVKPYQVISWRDQLSDMARQHCKAERVAPSKIRPNLRSLTPEIDRVVLKAINPDPKQRFQSVVEFKNAFLAAVDLSSLFDQTSEAKRSLNPNSNEPPNWWRSPEEK